MTHTNSWPRVGLVICVVLAVSTLGVAGCQPGEEVDALYQAAGDGDIERVKALLDHGVDVNGRTSDDSYALNRAAVYNQVEMVRLLLDRGANPNVRNSQGDTPLICATKYAGGHAEIVKLLVDGGTDLAIRDEDGKTALDYAEAQEQHQAVVLFKTSGS